MEQDRETAEVVEIVNAFRRILRRLRLAAGQTQTKTGISAAQLFVLSALRDGEPLSINELATRTLTDRSSVASVVERLTDRGLVARRQSPQDRRRAEVRITKTGADLLEGAPATPAAQLIEGLHKLSREDVAALARGLDHLTEAMGLGTERAAFMFEDDEPASKKAAVDGS